MQGCSSAMIKIPDSLGSICTFVLTHYCVKTCMFIQCLICRCGFDMIILRSTKTWFNRDALALIRKRSWVSQSAVLRYLTLCLSVCNRLWVAQQSNTCVAIFDLWIKCKPGHLKKYLWQILHNFYVNLAYYRSSLFTKLKSNFPASVSIELF